LLDDFNISEHATKEEAIENGCARYHVRVVFD